MNEIKELKIGKNFRIVRCDELNLKLEEWRLIKNLRAKKDAPKERYGWIRCGYYSNLPQALEKLLTVKISEIEKENIKDILTVLEESVKEIKEAVSHIKVQNFVKPEDNRGKSRKDKQKSDDEDE
jgi:hypothetical protein